MIYSILLNIILILSIALYIWYICKQPKPVTQKALETVENDIKRGKEYVEDNNKKLDNITGGKSLSEFAKSKLKPE